MHAAAERVRESVLQRSRFSSRPRNEITRGPCKNDFSFYTHIRI